MIFGIGVDMVKIERIASSLDKFGNRIAEKVLTEQELVEFLSARWPANFLAKRFAAKEAMAKALGTGFRNNLSLKNIEVLHDDTGKPVIACNHRARELMDENRINFVHLSIADEQDNAVALVVLESAPGQKES